jgi:hypothetical protein
MISSTGWLICYPKKRDKMRGKCGIRILMLGLLLQAVFLPYATAQELLCNVQVVTQQIQGTNKQIFETLQNDLYEFMNNRKWTNHVYEYNERIECNIMINITEQISSDEFVGTMQVQSRRPTFHSTYNSVMLNFKDNNVKFRYVEFEPLEFSETEHRSNLVSMMAYYAYIILGFDYDSFGPDGGTEYFEKAERIVNNAQNATEPGWKAFEGSGNRNRYWLIKNLLDDQYSPARDFIYRYHRLGLDVMADNRIDGRAAIVESLRLLQGIYREKPDPYLFLLQVIFDAKSDELVNIFKSNEAPPDERRRTVEILDEIDPANRSKYDGILQAQ